MVTLTEGATREIRRLVEHAEGLVSGVRIVIRQGTCAGTNFLWALETGPPGTDAVFELDNVKIFVDETIQPLQPGTRIDFVECRHGAGFLFDNRADPDHCAGSCERDNTPYR